MSPRLCYLLVSCYVRIIVSLDGWFKLNVFCCYCSGNQTGFGGVFNRNSESFRQLKSRTFEGYLLFCIFLLFSPVQGKLA